MKSYLFSLLLFICISHCLNKESIDDIWLKVLKNKKVINSSLEKWEEKFNSEVGNEPKRMKYAVLGYNLANDAQSGELKMDVDLENWENMLNEADAQAALDDWASTVNDEANTKPKVTKYALLGYALQDLINENVVDVESDENPTNWLDLLKTKGDAEATFAYWEKKTRKAKTNDKMLKYAL